MPGRKLQAGVDTRNSGIGFRQSDRRTGSRCVFTDPTEYTESGLKLWGLDLASLATQGVGAWTQPNAYTGYGIIST